MKTYKIVILGPQCSGKTTLVKYLRMNNSFPLVEEDEMFAELNNGLYPLDIEYKENILRLKLENNIRNSGNIIFVTSYCEIGLLKELKEKGFHILQLMLDKDKLEERNKKRIKEQGYEDAEKWLDDNLKFHQKAKDLGLVHKVIDADRPIEIVAQEILQECD